MKMKLVILSGLIAAMSVACDDSSSSSTNSSDNGSSSSAAVESSSSAVAGVSSSSEEPVTASSSSAAEIASSSSAVESSSSPVTDQCSAMDKNDITTWHFVRDTFGGSVTYTYSVDADGKIIVTTKASDGTEKIAQTYPGSSAAYMEMVYNAALSTCRGE